MTRIRCRSALAAVVLGVAAHAAPLLAQQPPFAPPGQPGVGPAPGAPPLTKDPVAIPVARPEVGIPTRGGVPVVIPTKELELGDQRAKGTAPTGVQVTAASPVALTVAWQLPPCAAGTRISVGTSFGGERTFYSSDTLPVSRSCAGARVTSRGLKLPGGGTAPIEAAGLVQNLGPVQPGRTYYVKVAAFYRDSASRAAEPVNVTTPPPPPFTISSVKSSAGAVDLGWTETLRPSRYLVFRDNAELGDAGAATSFRDQGVKPNVSYTYRIDAVYDAVFTDQKYGAVPPVIISATTTSKTPYPAVVGFADTHTHPFANLASGGRLFWGAAFGPIEAVLSICESWHGFGGLTDVVGNIKRTISGAVSLAGHKTGGYPHFDGWPSWNTLDHQQMHSDWIYRAYQGGLRLMVSHAVNNALICAPLAKAPGRTCDDMEAADVQIDAAKAMENYTDMQNGGPGRGWFRIAYTPAQARQIIQDGKLAVVLGIEVDKLFGCGKGECDAATVNTQLEKYYQKGVRHLYPVHFADNAFGGYALGGVLFAANSMAANPGGLVSFDPPKEEDCSSSFSQKCNQLGLTPLGSHLITSMMNKGMIIDIDHMSKKTTDGVLALTSARHYPVISGHTGFVGTAMPGHSSERDKSDAWLMTMKQDGGMVSVGLTPGDAKLYNPSWRSHVLNDCPKTSKSWVQSYLYAVDKMGGPDAAAVGLASDQFLNELLGPRFDGHCVPQTGLVFYPISTRTGVTLQPSKAGTRTFDYNTEGLAHFGLLPEFIQDLKNEGLTDRDLGPLFRSAEGYIQLWERSVAGIPTP